MARYVLRSPQALTSEHVIVSAVSLFTTVRLPHAGVTNSWWKQLEKTGQSTTIR